MSVGERNEREAWGNAALYAPQLPTDRERLVTLYQVSRTVASLWELDVLHERLIELLMATLRADRCVIFLLDEVTQEPQPVASRNLEGDTLRDAATCSHRVVQSSVTSARALYSKEAQQEFSQFESIMRYNILSFVCVPLKLPQHVIGAIYVDSRDPLRIFEPQDVDFLAAFANLAALAIENARLHRKRLCTIDQLESALEERFKGIVGTSPGIREVLEKVSQVATTSVPVLIVGESGTGKELIARSIHLHSSRKDRVFVTLNCAAIPEQLLESELFGHARGAFSGALRDKKGLFEEADQGTLLLDEVGDLSLATQSKLLRVLQSGEIRRVGETRSRHVDVRIVSATNKDLAKAIEEKQFREDLYYRLNVVSLQIPPLRERREDIPLLVRHFLLLSSDRYGKQIRGIDSDGMDLLCSYGWPGNVRQLENEIERAVALTGEGEMIISDAFSDEVREGGRLTRLKPQGRFLKDIVAEVEREVIRQELDRHKWNRTQAAKSLGLTPKGLRNKIMRYGIERRKKT